MVGGQLSTDQTVRASAKSRTLNGNDLIQIGKLLKTMLIESERTGAGNVRDQDVPVTEDCLNGCCVHRCESGEINSEDAAGACCVLIIWVRDFKLFQ